MIKKILQILIILFLLSFAVNTIRQVVKLNQAKTKFAKAIERLDGLKAENQNLQAELQFRETPEFIEKEARDKLGLAKEGEVIVVLPKFESQSQEDNSKKSNLRFWLQRLFGT